MAPPLPAAAMLASTLLQRSSDGQIVSEVAQGRHESQKDWDLIRDIDSGVPSPPENSIFSCGRVVGISGLYTANERGEGNDGSDIQVWVGELSLHVLVYTLTGRLPLESTFPRAFVVQFLDSRPISRESLFQSIQQRLPSKSAADVEDLISKIQIYQTFEFDDILEAVARISDTLYNIQQQINQAASSAQGRHEPTLVILEGIDRSLEEIIRASNPLAAQARLLPLLRTLTILSRTYSSFVTVIVVNALPLPATIPGSVQQGRDYRPSQRQESSSTQDRNHLQQPQSHPLIPVQSIFARAPAPRPPGSSAFSRSAMSYATILARTLDQGFDIHLLVSKVQNRMVIEVAKDRLGDNLGRWCAL
ncbi:hypothetical protein VTO42DRAFT_8665 [Malbranchea cinnamomea]